MPLDPYLCTYSQRFPHHRTVCPHGYLRDILTRIGEHPINRIDELLLGISPDRRRKASPPNSVSVKTRQLQPTHLAYKKMASPFTGAATQSGEKIVMRRQLAAIVFGVIVAVAVIYAVFDQRVSVRNLFANAPSSQQSN